MELVEAIAKRRSVKRFADTPVCQEVLVKLIEVARMAPSGANKNASRFVLITERQSLERLGEIAGTCRWLASAQAGIAIITDPAATQYWLEDSCVAATFIWLAATDLGLGVAWAAMHQSAEAEEGERRQGVVRDLLSVPTNLNVPIVLGLGYPETAPGPRTIPQLEEIIAWERYARQ